MYVFRVYNVFGICGLVRSLSCVVWCVLDAGDMWCVQCGMWCDLCDVWYDVCVVAYIVMFDVYE